MSVDQAALDIYHEAVVHIILHEPFHCCVDIVNVDILNFTCDIVLAAKV